MFGLNFFRKQKKYCSCNLIEHGIDFFKNRINICCRVRPEEYRPIIKDFDGKNFDIAKIFSVKRQQRKQVRNGNLFPECKGCIYLEEKDWDNDDYISYINFNNWACCNLACCYCNVEEQKTYIKDQYNVYPLIKTMLDKGYLRHGGDITIAGGEPTLAPEFEDLLNLLVDNKFSPIRVLSNSTVYSPAIEAGIKSGQVNICTSVDSGTSEMFYKIKGFDLHDKVWSNLQKYASVQPMSSLVIAKYILIPDCNDKKDELDSFVKKVIETGIKRVAIDVEASWYFHNQNNLPALLFEIFRYAIELFNKNNLDIEFLNRCELLRQKLNL